MILTKGPDGIGLRVGKRANVVDVNEGLPAQAAGVSVGDQVVCVDGVHVCTHDDVRRCVAAVPEGGSLRLTLAQFHHEYNAFQRASPQEGT